MHFIKYKNNQYLYFMILADCPMGGQYIISANLLYLLYISVHRKVRELLIIVLTVSLKSQTPCNLQTDLMYFYIILMKKICLIPFQRIQKTTSLEGGCLFGNWKTHFDEAKMCWFDSYRKHSSFFFEKSTGLANARS